MTGRLDEPAEPLDASDYAFAIIVARFNAPVTERLLESARSALSQANAAKVDVFSVPGAFELPLAAKVTAESDDYDAVICLGAVIRGETPHFEYVSNAAAEGILRASLETEIPISFGVLTTDTREQADARLDKGAEAARTAIEMAMFLDAFPDEDEDEFPLAEEDEEDEEED